MGASRVQDLFARVKEAPSIIFVDEIDVVAKSRDGRFRIVNDDEREQTLNQLLMVQESFPVVCWVTDPVTMLLVNWVVNTLRAHVPGDEVETVSETYITYRSTMKASTNGALMMSLSFEDLFF